MGVKCGKTIDRSFNSSEEACPLRTFTILTDRIALRSKTLQDLKCTAWL